MRRVPPRSSQTVARDRLARKRRSWLISTIALRRCARSLSSHSIVGQVEMVGRLVEQQDVGIGRQHARQRGAARFAAGQVRRDPRRRAGRAVRADTRRGSASSPGAEAGFDIGQRRRRSRRNPAPAADSARWRRAARSALPRSGSISPAAIFSSVDLPEPLRPTRQTRSPAETTVRRRRTAACRRRSARCR